jgi:phospholipid/cholesterol/gamma-HCH transport system substrate-binding protein
VALFLVRYSRPIGLLAIAAVVAAFAVTLLREARGAYTINARFLDAGQLVDGGAVQVGGRTVGTISALRLTDDGLAEVVMKVNDERFRPLHRGTVATIRQVGLSGVANRFVELSPGPRSAPAIPDGGVLSTSETKGIVDLDHLLNTLDPPTRGRLQRIIRNSARIFDGAPSPRDANRAFLYLNPALSQARILSEEALLDQAALEGLIRTSATLATVFAGRRGDVQEGIANTAVALRALARERAALADSLGRAPAVMRQGRRTLRNLRAILPTVRPALREAQPVARPLARTLRQLPPTVQQATPVVEDLDDAVGPLKRALNTVPDLEREALPAVRSLTIALEDVLPIVVGLRPYADDLINGFLIGFGGASSGYYDANGPYSRVSLQVAPEGALVNLFALLFPGFDPGDLTGYRTGLVERCPGAASEPAPDGSNPWKPREARCDRDDDHEG